MLEVEWGGGRRGGEEVDRRWGGGWGRRWRRWTKAQGMTALTTVGCRRYHHDHHHHHHHHHHQSHHHTRLPHQCHDPNGLPHPHHHHHHHHHRHHRPIEHQHRHHQRPHHLHWSRDADKPRHGPLQDPPQPLARRLLRQCLLSRERDEAHSSDWLGRQEYRSRCFWRREKECRCDTSHFECARQLASLKTNPSPCARQLTSPEPLLTLDHRRVHHYHRHQHRYRRHQHQYHHQHQQRATTPTPR